MAKKKKPSATEEFDLQEKIKKLVIIAMFSNDELMDRFVLKGGNALDLIHHASTRASVDIDLSIAGDFTLQERNALQGRLEKVLGETFRPEGYHVFDVRAQEKPKGLTPDLADFWGGYDVEFKLIALDRYEALKTDLESMRKYAVKLGQGQKFLVDISKHEFVAGKARQDLDGYAIFVYTPEMIACEKLRAICQQMPEYGPVIKRTRAASARARDFVDIHSLVTASRVDLTTPKNLQLLASMFAAKRVKLSLLRNVDQYREAHRTNFDAVRATVKPGVTLKEFDFYVDFVIELIVRLEPLGDE